MSDLMAMVEAMPPEEQAVACRVLDALSSPLTVRQIEALLRHGGVSRMRAVKLASALKHWRIIAMIGPEKDDG